MEDVDRISDLPDSILTHILSFLSTKEAVGTSILYSREMVHGPRVYSWISTAVRRGVKHLDISISPDQFTSPGIMFTCRSLTTLKLDFTCSVLDVPRGVPFPNLKTLHLKSVEFLSDDTTKCLLSSCNNLEDLSSCEYADLLINVKWSSSMDKGLEILLSSSPELEKLACHQEVLSKLPEKVAYCLLSKLKVMEILGFRNDKDVIEKAKNILKNVGALQKLTIRTLSNISKAKKLKMSEVLLGSPRESKHCCILIV
ncbi:hypothetical protein Golob_021124 [Gossypium lobatum]|uniref:FBD domain-containing protein n=1 Tax=Gossypium lobatum TaxID=34289 RepID=A0A7J8LCH1_9ROSI|nr:hypothetical protein [Gossypium lobatum]